MALVTSTSAGELKKTPLCIGDEETVDRLGDLSHYQACYDALKTGSRLVQQALGIEVTEPTFMPKPTPYSDPMTGSQRKPDWSIYLHTVPKPIAIAYGDSKCRSKWVSVPRTCPEFRRYHRNWIWQFRQVLSYCVNASTRYGFILTPEELVVLRIHENSNTPKKPWRIEYASIHGTIQVQVT